MLILLVYGEIVTEKCRWGGWKTQSSRNRGVGCCLSCVKCTTKEEPHRQDCSGETWSWIVGYCINDPTKVYKCIESVSLNLVGKGKAQIDLLHIVYAM